MIAKEFTLSGKKKFDDVLKNGEMFQSDSFGIVKLKRGDDEVSHYGFLVSTKAAKDAFRRNKIKRALSEAVRFSLFKAVKGYDVVFLAKSKSAVVDTGVLMRETTESLEKAGLIK
jgi:ribonuclease P protein component